MYLVICSVLNFFWWFLNLTLMNNLLIFDNKTVCGLSNLRVLNVPGLEHYFSDVFIWAKVRPEFIFDLPHLMILA